MRLLIALVLLLCLLAFIVHGQGQAQESEAKSWLSYFFPRQKQVMQGKEGVAKAKNTMQQKRLKHDKKLWAACFHGNATKVDELLREASRLFGDDYSAAILAEASVAEQGESLLGISAARGNTEVLQLMLSPPHDAHIETRNEYGQTPLMMACKQNRLEAVKLLLHYDHDSHEATSSSSSSSEAAVAVKAETDPASVNLKNDYGDTALLVAVKHGRSAIVKYLLSECLVVSSSGSNRISSNSNNDSSSSIANSSKQKQEIDLEEEDGEGNTALIIARLFGYTEIIDLLLEKGADPNHERGSRKRANEEAVARTTATTTKAAATENQGDDL